MNSRAPVNPYIAGSPVTGAEMFFGRDDVFAFIRRNLIGQHRDSPILLYGQRRTGKTSVLYQLYRQLGPGYRCIFIDLHGLDLTGMGNFLLDIANAISRGLQRDYQLTVPVPDDEIFLANPRSVFETVFLDAVWSALDKDHLVLMMDEVVRLDDEVKAGRIEREVFDYLRHLMQHHAQLNFVFSLGSNLEGMRKDYAFLFSVSLYHRISFLEPTAARDLIIEPAREHYQVAPEAVTKIMRITSGHPYYTQLVCHCLFDQWSRSPKPVMTEADVDAILSDAIELGSANLTYVWEDSTPEEQAVMAGLAAAMRGEACSVTLDDARESWQTVSVLLPAREGTRALRSLVDREVVAGNRVYSFTVDLQRLWIEQHRRLEWVKEDLGDQVGEWKRSAELLPSHTIPAVGRTDVKTPGPTFTGRIFRARRDRYLAIAAVMVLLAGYLTAAAVAHVFPFSTSSSTPSLTTQLRQLLGRNVNMGDCRAAPRPEWKMPGLVHTLHCADDPGLPGGNVYAYQLDNAADYEAAWQNFNTWWKFPASVTKTCPPPAGAVEGMVSVGAETAEECAPLPLSAGVTVPAYAWPLPDGYTFVIAEARLGSSFSVLTSWLTHRTSSKPILAKGVIPLVELLPGDIDDPSSQCQPYRSPDWAVPGLVTSEECTDPGLPGNNDDVFAFQFDSYANYLASWQAFNQVIGFNSISKGPSCPPPSNDAAGTTQWKNQYLPYRNGQVLECGTVGSGSIRQPEYIWTFLTEDAYVWARGTPGMTMSALNTWWEDSPMNKPTPSP